MDERALAEKLRRIEALFAGAATDGERQAAAEAAKRITARLQQARDKDSPVEYRFRFFDKFEALVRSKPKLVLRRFIFRQASGFINKSVLLRFRFVCVIRLRCRKLPTTEHHEEE